MLKLKKIASLAIGCLLLSACASDGHLVSIPEAMANKNWTGHPINEAIAKWGKPFSIAPAGDGTTLYQWGFSSTYTYDEYKGSSYAGDTRTDYYAKEVGIAGCRLKINADASGIITHLETTQTTSGCTNFYWGSDSVSPDAASAAKANVMVDRQQKAKELVERYEMVCHKPEYAEIISDPHCDDFAYFTVAPDVKMLKLTPRQKELFSKYRADMEDVVNAYVGFLRSTGERGDKAQADAVDGPYAPKPVADNYNGGLANERRAATTARRLSAYVRQIYLK